MTTGTQIMAADDKNIVFDNFDDWYQKFDFSEVSTFTKNGSNEVTALIDSSGNGRDATVFNAPLYVADVVNGNSVLRMNADTQYALTSSQPVLKNYTLVLVQKYNAEFALDILATPFSWADNNITNVIDSFTRMSSVYPNGYISSGRNNTRSSFFTGSTGNIVDGDPHSSIVTIQDGAGDTAEGNLYNDGVLAGSSSILNSYDASSRDMYLGALAVNTRNYAGDYCFFGIIDGVLTDSQRNSLQALINNKWGIS